jgi:hypothetical protein
MNFAGRSNCVKVRDLVGLKESLKPFSHLFLYESNDKHYISAENYDPIFQSAEIVVDDEFGEVAEIEFDPQIHVIPFLEDKEILIMMEVAHEKLRYIYGASYAWMKGRNRLCVDLDHIHRMIEQQWNTDEYDSF